VHVRRDAPDYRYGFYILNRGGMNDFSQTMYPWDDMKRQEHYHLYKTYPDYTAQVLSGNLLPSPEPTEGQSYDPHEARKSTKPVMIGFWTFDPAEGELLTETLNRLAAFSVTRHAKLNLLQAARLHRAWGPISGRVQV
jgi:hypothetical protein